MLTPAEFNSLEAGDRVELSPIFPGLSTTAAEFLVEEVTDGVRSGTVVYFGVSLFRLEGTLTEDTIIWRKP